MKIHFKTLGCRLNDAESLMWAQQSQKSGFETSEDYKQAQIIVINSCAVTQQAVSKSYKELRKFRRENHSAHIVFSGCVPSLPQNQILDKNLINQVIPNNQKDNLIPILQEKFTLKKQNINPEQKHTNIKHSRAFIKVQDGCRNRCTFCIVTKARGAEKSKEIQNIIQEIQNLEQQNYQEIVISGVHLGGYGSDISSNLEILLQAILDNTKIARIRLGSLEPWDIPSGFFKLWQNPRLLPHLHLPLQSGCDNTLRRMARRSMTKDFYEIIRQARDLIPLLNITTDLIIGFPGESDQEWEICKQFVKKIGFGHIHVFPYSTRSGTKAALLENQINTPTKKQRVQEMLAISTESKRNFLQKFINKSTNILCERKKIVFENKNYYTGYSENFIKTLIKPTRDLSPNQIYSCVLTKPIFVDNHEVFEAIPT